ncbi:hypothetical protein MJD09_16750 [bacterium]|nr:hypothetical protein [bacterium]
MVGSSGKISGMDAKNGKTKWSVDAYKKFEGSHGIWGTSENLLVEDNMTRFTVTRNINAPIDLIFNTLTKGGHYELA